MSKLIAKKDLRFEGGYLLEGASVINDKEIVELFNGFLSDMERARKAEAGIKAYKALEKKKKVSDVKALFDKHEPDIKAIEDGQNSAKARAKALQNLDSWIKAEALYTPLVEWIAADYVLVKGDNLTTDKFDANPLGTNITAENIVKHLADLVDVTTESKGLKGIGDQVLTI